MRRGAGAPRRTARPHRAGYHDAWRGRLRGSPARARPGVVRTHRHAHGQRPVVGEGRGSGTGADAYLTKPFASGELLVQVHALLRLVESRERTAEERPLTCGPLELWPDQRRVTVREKR